MTYLCSLFIKTMQQLIQLLFYLRNYICNLISKRYTRITWVGAVYALKSVKRIMKKRKQLHVKFLKMILICSKFKRYVKRISMFLTLVHYDVPYEMQTKLYKLTFFYPTKCCVTTRNKLFKSNVKVSNYLV